MSSLLARILMAIVMVPLASVMYMVVFIWIEDQSQDDFAFLWADIIVGLFVVLYWLGLWRRSICWTRRRITWTVLSGFSSVGVGMAVSLGLALQLYWVPQSLFFFLTGIIAIPVWLLVTLLLWRETPAERAERIRKSFGKALFCPCCGYNMTGLHESRCPECGSKYTLDQLLARHCLTTRS